jgi:hypothetical protein
VIAGEVPGDYAGPEAPGRVQTAAGVEDSDQFGDKQCKADTDRGEEGGFVLFGCEHEDGDDEVRNISMKTPWAMDTSSPKVVETFNSPGNMAETTPAAQIPASICEIKHRTARVVVRAPIK